MAVYNFSAGPAALPAEVMKKAQAEFCDFMGTGSGVLELSHRGPQFSSVIAKTEANIRELMNISDDYDVLFIQGGASMQFAMAPMNFIKHEEGAFSEYADTGMWSAKAMKEAKGFGEVKVIASSKDTNYDKVPPVRRWKLSNGSSYLHITTNNTVAGTQYHVLPTLEDLKGTPLVADMSSDIMSSVINVNDFGMIYAGAQKNLGPSGVALVIVRKDLVARTPEGTPSMLRYDTYAKSDSMFNTPPTFAIYMLGLVTDWIKEKGGIAVVEEINIAKSEALYETIDGTEFYNCPVASGSRSRMNVVFRLPSEELEAKFLKEAAEKRMTGLKGHRAVGGIRASIYNAMPLSGVEALVDFMNEFEKNNS